MTYLYDESPSASRKELQAHLESCAACQKQVATWREATHQLNEWPSSRVRRGTTFPIVRWAAAAAIVGLAIAGGARVNSLGREVRQLRSDMRGQVQQELNAALAQVSEQASKSATAEAQELIAAVAQKLEEKRLNDRQTTLTALQNLNAQRVADYAKLRKELETVAVFSEAGLQRAENQISSLAYTPANFSKDN